LKGNLLKKHILVKDVFCFYITIYIKIKIKKNSLKIMGTHIKVFSNHSDYEAFIASGTVYMPNVSVCEQEYEVHYLDNGHIDKPVPPIPTHEYVEISGVKWATMNLGATAVTDNGLYYQWGDTQGYTPEQVGEGEGKKYFGEEDYKFFTNGELEYTKYNSSDGKEELDLSDDAVHVAWGENWRMPTSGELQSLLEATTSGWTNDYQGTGVAGLIFTDKTDSSKVLFFPAAGTLEEGEIEIDETFGEYWSSSVNLPSEIGNSSVYILDFLKFNDSKINLKIFDGYRTLGLPIRGVLDNNS
jgi:hypothetical protein